MPSVEVARVAIWKQRKALAEYLWERGPMTAQYIGQMGDQVARILNQKLERRTKFERGDAVKLISEMVELGELSREMAAPNSQIIAKITWLGGDPELVEWTPPKPERTASPGRIDELELRVMQLEEDVLKLQQNITLSVREAIRELANEYRAKGIQL